MANEGGLISNQISPLSSAYSKQDRPQDRTIDSKAPNNPTFYLINIELKFNIRVHDKLKLPGGKSSSPGADEDRTLLLFGVVK